MIETYPNLNKNLKKGLLATAAAVGLLSVSACSGEQTASPKSEQSSQVDNNKDKQESLGSATPSPEATIYTNEQMLENPDLLKQVYPELPTSVEKASKAAISITGDSTQVIEHYSSSGEFLSSESKFAQDENGEVEGSSGSGMTVTTSDGKKAILTAGHVLKPNAKYCASADVNFQTNSGGMSQPMSRQDYVYEGNGEELSEPDIGLILTSIEKDQPTVPIATKASVNPGEVVFAQTYQPQQDGSARNPVYEGDGEDPAKYSAMVLGVTSSGLIAVLERGRSYGEVEDTHSVKGASGGGLLNAKGQLWGIVAGSVGGEESNEMGVRLKIVDAAINEKNETIREIDYKEDDGVMLVQPITQSDVDGLYDQAKDSEACKTRPVKRVIDD